MSSDKPEELFSLKGQVAVVIGGARDLGMVMASALAAAGADIVVTSRTEEHAAQAAAELTRSHGVQSTHFGLDVTCHSDVQRVAERATAWRGRIDVLINNAGGSLGLSPTEFFARRPEHVEKLIAVNLVGLIFSCQEFARPMVERRNGKIINIASIAGLVGRDRRMYGHPEMAEQPVDYAAAKAGVIGVTRDLAAVLAPARINVNAISPGGFERGQPTPFIDAYSDQTPLGRMGRDGFDLQGATLFLASKASEYVTGQNIVVDGGFSTCK